MWPCRSPGSTVNAWRCSHSQCVPSTLVHARHCTGGIPGGVPERAGSQVAGRRRQAAGMGSGGWVDICGCPRPPGRLAHTQCSTLVRTPRLPEHNLLAPNIPYQNQHCALDSCIVPSCEPYSGPALEACSATSPLIVRSGLQHERPRPGKCLRSHLELSSGRDVSISAPDKPHITSDRIRTTDRRGKKLNSSGSAPASRIVLETMDDPDSCDLFTRQTPVPRRDNRPAHDL